MSSIAQCASSVVGCISPPKGITPFPTAKIGGAGVLMLGPAILLLNLILKLVFIAAGLYAFFNLIAAGYQFIGAGGDAKAVAAAWNKIMGTFIGIIVIISSFLIAAIMGRIFFGDATYFLQPSLFI